MCFPIHGYPNDYWRFTPEAFRALVSNFPYAGIFFCGPPEFPHTVCAIAAKNKYDATAIQTLAERARDIKKTAPLIVEEGRTAKIIHRLMTKLVPAKSTPSQEISAGFDKLAQPLGSGHGSMDCRWGRAGECA
jgi:hypothetical protein